MGQVPSLASPAQKLVASQQARNPRDRPRDPPSIVFCGPFYYVSPDRLVFEVDEREPLPQAIGHDVGFLLFLDTPRRRKLAGVNHALIRTQQEQKFKIGGPPRAHRSGSLPTRQDKQQQLSLQTQPLDGQRVS